MTILVLKIVLFLCFLWFIGSALYVHFRGKVRMRAGRQVTDFSTFLAPFNVLGYIFSKVPNTPYLPMETFPELKPLRDNWETIRDEAVNLDKIGEIGHGEGMAFKSFYKNDRWRRFYLSWYGKQYDAAKEHCPKTLELVNSIPSVNAALFVRLNPGKSLNRHRDPFSISLRYHLGLVTPNDDRCRIIVDGQSMSWRDGQDFIFDETYVHEAKNETDQARIILFCDIQRPMVNRFLDWVAAKTCQLVAVLTVANNKEAEHTNLINDLLEKVLYPTSHFFQRQKAKNRKLYYRVKHSLMALIVAGIVYALWP